MTTTIDLVEERPVVLIVEDMEESLNLRVRLFQGEGCTPVGVRDSDSALRELSSSPGIDLVVADIHLQEASDDKSGLALARYLRATVPELPLAGYSAYFDESKTGRTSGPNELSESEIAVFDLWFPKGRLRRNELKQTVADCKQRALEHRRTRRQDAGEALAELRRRYESEVPVVEVLRRLVPDTGGPALVEAALHAAGYRLHLVKAGEVAGLVEPVPVWIVETVDGVEAEVYGQPQLYSHSSNEAGAITDLLELMHLFAQDLQSSDTDSLHPAAEKLKAYLLGLFRLDSPDAEPQPT